MLNLKTVTIRKDENKKYWFFWWLYFFIKPYKWLFIFLTINRIIRSGLAIATPIFIKIIIDYIESGKFSTNPKFVLYILGAFVIVKLFYFAQLYFSYPFETRLYNKIAWEISLYGVNHILSLPMKRHESKGSWTKLARIFQARSAFRAIMSDYFWEYLRSAWVILSIFFTVYGNAWREVLLLFFICMGVFTCIAIWGNIKLDKVNTEMNRYRENNVGKVYDLTSLFTTVKNLNITKNILKEAQKTENKLMKKVDKRSQVQNTRMLYSDNLSWLLMYLMIAGFGFWQLLHGDITTGTFIFILMIIDSFWDALESIGDNYRAYIENKNAFMRLMKDLEEPKENFDEKPYIQFNPKWKEIQLKNLHFQYNDEKCVLRNINITIKKWEKVAFVWPSGSWKTTILKLLLKQYQSEKWTVLFDTIDIRNITKSSLLNNVAVVSQDAELFNISIKENILIRGKNPEKFDEYITKADCKNFIEKLPQKEHSVVWERGLMLSWGEKQRINIARALACETDIIFFDEATSSLDTISEEKIQKVINTSFEDKTLIVIAHRLSTIKHVDKIYVINNWELVEQWGFNYLVHKWWLFTQLRKKQQKENKNKNKSIL